ncbi:hypothetical protein Ddye_020694 [Dipteronia dyeriana]|uniref:Transposase n=1 Tax=Dipteronia dyeriana TaxID=168575 RepID=A0AAD9U191_9ROSI|nr:hypothetical protein Ddye_020694 [Dipteronia dyeriana]
MIVLLYTLSGKETGNAEVPSDEYRVWVYLPWSVEKKEVSNDSELLEVFRSFSEHKKTKIMFEIEKMPYISVPFAASSSDIPNPQPMFMTNLNEVEFSGFEETIFYGDGENDDVGENEHVGADELGDQIDLGVHLGGDLGSDYGVDLGAESDEMGGVPDLRELSVIPEVPEFVCRMQYKIGNNDLFEGYQSNREYEFFSDSDNERDDSKLTLVTKSIPFKKLVGAPIRFECPWRMHASIVGDETTMQVKTYNNEHTCHRIYKSQEARSKWIATQKRGFLEGCRPFIGIDGCHLKVPYGRVILSAVTLDANSGLYPLAYCICKGSVQGIFMPISKDEEALLESE